MYISSFSSEFRLRLKFRKLGRSKFKLGIFRLRDDIGNRHANECGEHLFGQEYRIAAAVVSGHDVKRRRKRIDSEEMMNQPCEVKNLAGNHRQASEQDGPRNGSRLPPSAVLP